MARNERVNVKAILADPDLRRELMVRTIQATQAREGIETTEEQAERAYYVVTESERASFFDLERFRTGKKGDRRHDMFVMVLAGDGDDRVRFDVSNGISVRSRLRPWRIVIWGSWGTSSVRRRSSTPPGAQCETRTGDR